jgi:tetratricopeptide (TPR) repeat protein
MQPDAPKSRLSNVTILLILGAVCGVLLLMAVAAVGVGYQVVQRNNAKDAERAKATEEAVSKFAPPPQQAEFTEQELLEFAVKVETIALESDMHAAASLLDGEAFTDTAMTGLAMNRVLKEFHRAMVDQVHTIFPDLLRQAQGGRYEFVRIRYSQNRPCLLFRLIGAQGELSYHEFFVDRRSGEPMRAVDFYNYGTGELMSQTIRRMALALAAQEDKDWIEKLSSSEREFVREFESLGRMAELLKAGNHVEALKIYETLSPTMRSNKTIAVMRLQIAGGCEDSEYLAAVEDFRRRFPDDPSLSLYEIGYYAMRKDFDQALQAVARMDELVGGDPYLLATYVALLVEAKRIDEARTFAETSLQDNPHAYDLYWGLIGVGLEQQDYELVLSTLKGIDENFDVQWASLEDEVNFDFSEFLKSPEHEEWLHYLALKSSDQPRASDTETANEPAAP